MGPSLRDPTVALSLHSFNVTLRTPFLYPSLRPESVSLLVFSVLMQLRKAERVSFALAFSVSFDHSTIGAKRKLTKHHSLEN